MRITYTRDHYQRSYIIQIVLDDEQMIGLPLSVNLQPSMFVKLSTQLRLLASMAEFLEAAQTEEDSNMAIFPEDQENMDETEEEYQEEEDTPDEEEAEIEEAVEDEVMEDCDEDDLEEFVPDEEDTEEYDEEEEEEEDDGITQSEGKDE